MPRASFLPLSVSRTSLLSNRSDAGFRGLLYDLFALTAILETARKEFAVKIDVAPSQYSMIRVVAERHRHGGITVSEVARTLQLHNSFVVLQTGLLVKKGILMRTPNPRDKRSVLLRLSRKGEQLVATIAPTTVLVNDLFFGWMNKEDFKHFSAIIAELVERGPAALDTLRSALPASTRRRRNIKDAATPKRLVNSIAQP
ncbi:DNA-binding transcriptional regulator, MarR family [Rhodospirillales bacterium URHD0017]|nr:DNA-binding transcriptional regulator, MarR family [Rhodospirillales bacterium URHD0017]